MAGTGCRVLSARIGAHIDNSRLRIEGNSASSITSTDPGSPSRAARIGISDTVNTGNSLRESIAEARHGGSVVVRASTITGSEAALTFLGLAPGGLFVSDTIVDRP